ncbi:uncharacterized protein MYCGRDRAFT_91642 [Zymoseptoria tritici IPO323]|uniref:Apple domain-containing protein n=1 Tax=Zymoseptoria tritici (strain CBS 115943 / IPO323) TaxID=336722 RepID=F9X7Q9_ZYMTI|nr:uncharacterized protein MYCGRDRAFT_91642 [Zymoseptoria tritici IPO323]EGP88776.1 hypothetical protein MYCGRDRAFT_91642 [Zymoseptoria tritici IPO323]
MRFLPLLAAALPIGGSLAAAVGIQDAGEVPDVNASLDKRYSTSPKCNVAGYSEEHYTPFQVIKQSKCSPQQCSSYCRQKSKCQSFADSDAAVLTLDSACRLVREVGGNIANVYLPKWPKSRHRARIIKQLRVVLRLW